MKNKKTAVNEDRKTGWALAIAGFLPFAAGTLAAYLPLEPILAARIGFATMAYGAVILSFLGGIRWGLALTGQPGPVMARDLGLSVFPSLWGWAAFLLGGMGGVLMLALGFAAMGAWDHGLAEDPRVSAWFVTLRRVLSVLVTGSMLAIAASFAV